MNSIPAKVSSGKGLRQHQQRPQDISTNQDLSRRTTFFHSHETSFKGSKVNKKTEQWNQWKVKKEKKYISTLNFIKTNQIHPKIGKKETDNIKGFPIERRKPSSLLTALLQRL